MSSLGGSFFSLYGWRKVKWFAHSQRKWYLRPGIEKRYYFLEKLLGLYSDHWSRSASPSCSENIVGSPYRLSGTTRWISKDFFFGDQSQESIKQLIFWQNIKDSSLSVFGRGLWSVSHLSYKYLRRHWMLSQS